MDPELPRKAVLDPPQGSLGSFEVPKFNPEPPLQVESGGCFPASILLDC